MRYLILLAAVLLAVDGIRSIIEGVRTLANKSPDIEHDSESEKKLLSPYTRYWISRWYDGSVFLVARSASVFCKVVRNWHEHHTPTSLIHSSQLRAGAKPRAAKKEAAARGAALLKDE